MNTSTQPVTHSVSINQETESVHHGSIKQFNRFVKIIGLMMVILLWTFQFADAQTNPTAQSIPYTQDFGTTTFSTPFAGMASWTGGTGAANSAFSTQTAAEASSPVADQVIFAGTPASGGTGRQYGHAVSSNGRLTILQSGSTTSQIALAINTVGYTSVTLSYDLVLSVPIATRAIGLSLQYRIGTTGAFTSVPSSDVLYSGVTTNGGDADGATDFDNYSFSLPAPALGQAVVQLRWVSWRPAGSGNSGGLGLDNINITGTSSSTIDLAAAHPTAGNINQGSVDKIIGGISVTSTGGISTLSAVTVNTAGTYSAASDLSNIKFWINATNDLVSATQLGSNQAGVISGDPVGVSGLSSVTIPSGATRYILVTASVSPTATAGGTVRLGSTAYSNIVFTGSFSVNGTGPVAAGASPGNDQTITAVPPVIALSDASPAAGTINQNTTNNILRSVQVVVTDAAATLNAVTFKTAGSYVAGDLQTNGFKFWYNTANNLTGASPLGAAQAIVASGSDVSVSGLTQSFPIGTGFILMTVDVAYNANSIHDISIVNTSDNFTFSTGSPTGMPLTSGNAQTFGVVNPSVAITATGPGAGMFTIPSSNAIVYQLSLAATLNSTDLSSITLTTKGTYTTADFVSNSFRLWYNPSSSSLAGATQLGTDQALVSSGNAFSFSGLSQKITMASTGFFLVTLDVAAIPTMGHTFYIDSTAHNQIVFSHAGATKTGINPARLGGTQVFTPIATAAEVILPKYAFNGGTAGKRLQYVCRLTLNNLLPGATYRYFCGAALTSNTLTTGTSAGNYFGINNTSGSGGYIVGHSASKSMAGTELTANEFGTGITTADRRYSVLTADGSGSYTGWFAIAPTNNAAFAAGAQSNFYVQLNAGIGGLGDTSIIQSVKTPNFFTSLDTTSAAVTGGFGARSIRGTSAGIGENMVFLYADSAAPTSPADRPLYGTWLEDDGMLTNFTSWYSKPASSPVDTVIGSWGAYIPSVLPNGVRRIEQRNVATGAIEGCAATDDDGIWPSLVNTINPTAGAAATPLVIATSDASFICPILNTITVGTIDPLTYCVDGSANVDVIIPFSSTLTFNSGNIYKAQLSNASGDFTTPVALGGDLTSTANIGMVITGAIPPSTAPGTNYRIRITSTNPPDTSEIISDAITINNGGTYYLDSDIDFYGDANLLTPVGHYCLEATANANSYVSDHTDCDDANEFVNPGATEVCNAIDDDCDASIDEGLTLITYYRDADGDTYGNNSITSITCSVTPPSGFVADNTDCNDAAIAVHPGATESCNGIDDNCVLGIDEGCSTFTFFADLDGDTFGDPTNTTTNTVDSLPLGYVRDNTDCNDNPVGGAAIHPGVTEICNGIDDNCAGGIDEGLTFVNYYYDNDADTYGGTLFGSFCSAQAGKVTNNSDCDDTRSSVAPLPPVIISGVISFCAGGSTDLDAGTGAAYGGYTNYAWSTNDNTQSIHVTTAGTYTVTIIGVGGCQNTTSVTVSVNPLPVVTISGSTNLCTGATNILDAGTSDAGGNYVSYVWSPSGSSQTLAVSTAGTYTVTVTNVNNCTSSASKTVVDVPVPNITLTPTNVLCNGASTGAIATTATNPCTNGPGLVISRFVPNPLGADNNNEFVELLATRNIDFSVTPYSVVFVNNGTGTVNGWIQGTGTTYGFNITTGTAVAGQVYYVGGSAMVPTTNRLRVINIGTTAGDRFGSLNASGVAGNGGASADAVGVFAADINAITSSTVPVDAWIVGTTLGNAVVSGGSAGYQLPVNDIYPGGKIQLTSTVVGGAATDNTMVVATGTFNPGTGTFVTPRTFATVSLSPFTTSNYQVSLSTGFSYSWSNGATTASISNVAANSYTVTVTSCNGCTASFNSAITEPTAIVVSATTNTSASCSNLSDGVLEIGVSGGTPGSPTPYTYAWSGSASTSSTRNDLAPGTYTVTVTDANNCTKEGTFVVGSSATAITYYLDNDGDGHPVGSVTQCTVPVGNYTTTPGTFDCDDNNPLIFALHTYYVDGDNDGFGSTTVGLFCQLTAPSGFSSTNTDCNDGDIAIHDLVSYFVDADLDTYGSTTTSLQCSLTATSGYSINNTDCNDAFASINPGATETCNGIDDDCNTVIDNGNPGGGIACSTGLFGNCANGHTVCQSGVVVCVADHSPITEVCGNSIDDDCDAATDEGCVTNVSLTLHVFIQGFYSGGSSMTPVLNNTGISTDPLEVDSIIVELHDAASPYDLFESATGVLHTDGVCQLTYSPAVSGGSFYIVIKHRNSIETWSKDPVQFGPTNDFDLTQ